jgi:leucyl/phenylalanyl-tRNA--protein transferase
MAENPLAWLAPQAPFPSAHSAWDAHSPAPGLLAAGGALDIDTLKSAYGQGIFPWFSEGQPILWWSPEPRMVLKVGNFILHRSFKKSLFRFSQDSDSEIRIDTAFEEVIGSCALAIRNQQSGTWIVPAMVQAYIEMHQHGYAHSIEVWKNKKLVAGLYCIALGKAVFGESMFTTVPDGSKIALAALLALCKQQGVKWIDCQQNTDHLASLGAAPISRAEFLNGVDDAKALPSLDWRFTPIYWDQILSSP